MDEFSDLARVTFNRRKKKQPLFIRHQPTVKRHQLRNADRTDPTSQLLSVHLNAEYRDWIEGNTVVVLDDYLTYGASFGVAAALLRAAKAKKIICVAMGKFGGRAELYSIVISGNVFAPLSERDFVIGESRHVSGTVDSNAQLEFVQKFAEALR
jgi:hypothetical protein